MRERAVEIPRNSLEFPHDDEDEKQLGEEEEKSLWKQASREEGICLRSSRAAKSLRNKKSKLSHFGFFGVDLLCLCESSPDKIA